MRNLVGMATLAVLLAVVIRLAVDPSEWVGTTLLAFALAAPTALYMWRDSDKSGGPVWWLLMALGSIAIGGVFLLVDVSFGHSKNPDASFWQAALSSGSPFGIVLTILVCPGLTSICLAGAARAVYDRWRPSTV